MNMLTVVFLFVTLALGVDVAQPAAATQHVPVQVQQNEVQAEVPQMAVEAFTILGGRFEGTWNKIATPWVRSLSHYGGYVYGIGSDKAIYRVSQNGGRWYKLRGSCCVLQIWVGRGHIWGIGTDHAVYRRRIHGAWKKITTPWVSQIQIYGNHIFGIGSRKYIWRTGLSGQGGWRRLAESCCVTNMVLNGGYIYGVGTDRALYKRRIYAYFSHAWRRIAPCCVTQIQIWGNYVLGIGTNRHIYVTHKHRSHNTWRLLLRSCCVKHITVGGGRLFGIGTGHALWSKRSLAHVVADVAEDVAEDVADAQEIEE